MDSEQKKKIIQQVLQGQTEAFALLVDHYKGPVFNLAYRMTGSRQDAEDLTQETFLKAFLGLKRFDRQRRFFPWLFTVAVNTVRNHLKKTASGRPARSTVGMPELSPGLALLTAVILGLVGFLAGYFPARDAAKLDPVVAMKV
jgi:RNA polymerase sigma-70 factor (ECF subfamily)